MKVAIDDVVTSYSNRISSHKSSWAYLLKNKLERKFDDVTVLTKNDNIHDYDMWYILFPMEYGGENIFNLFGGANDETAERIQRLLDFEGVMFFVDQRADIGTFVDSRRKSCSEKWAALDSKLITQKCESIPVYDSSIESSGFILGDSHSVSVYRPGYNIKRMDGKTLHGILAEGIWTHVPKGTEHLITYFGNIDVRHHLMRQHVPNYALVDLVKKYFEQLMVMDVNRISVVKLLPVEFEGRRIPKTGYYKGEPFFGTQEERSQLVIDFNKLLDNYAKDFHQIDVIEWPEHWYEEDPKVFADTYMEKPGSVHLSREYYQYDFETNTKNSKLQKQTLF